MIRNFLFDRSKSYNFKENCKNCWFNFDGVCASHNDYAPYGTKIVDFEIDMKCFEIGFEYFCELREKNIYYYYYNDTNKGKSRIYRKLRENREIKVLNVEELKEIELRKQRTKDLKICLEKIEEANNKDDSDFDDYCEEHNKKVKELDEIRLKKGKKRN